MIKFDIREIILTLKTKTYKITPVPTPLPLVTLSITFEKYSAYKGIGGVTGGNYILSFQISHVAVAMGVKNFIG